MKSGKYALSWWQSRYRRFRTPLWVLLAVASPSPASSATVKITYPTNNTALILTQNSIQVTGTLALEPGDNTQSFVLYVDSAGTSKDYTISPAANGTWKRTVEVPRGRAFKLHAVWQGGEIRVIATATEPFPSQASQRVTLVWKGDVDTVLGAIAMGTLNGGLVPAGFQAQVRARTEQLFAEILSGYPGVKVEPADANGPGLYTVEVTGTEDPWLEFGRTSIQDSDCGNARAEGRSSVYVGSFARSMTHEAATWAPMAVTDSSAMRVEDIAQALASTAVHEFFHGMGLLTCPWMEGSPDGHNNPAFAYDGIPEALRFLHGEELMDSGLWVPPYRRLGETDKQRGIRAPRKLHVFNRSYLDLLNRPPA